MDTNERWILGEKLFLKHGWQFGIGKSALNSLIHDIKSDNNSYDDDDDDDSVV